MKKVKNRYTSSPTAPNVAGTGKDNVRQKTAVTKELLLCQKGSTSVVPKGGLKRESLVLEGVFPS